MKSADTYIQERRAARARGRRRAWRKQRAAHMAVHAFVRALFGNGPTKAPADDC